MSTLLDNREELDRRVTAEGIDPSKVVVLRERWDETPPRREETKSALVRCDLIIRSDGSAVALDGDMGMDSTMMLNAHAGLSDSESLRRMVRSEFPELGDLDEEAVRMCRKAQKLLGWEDYSARFTILP